MNILKENLNNIIVENRMARRTFWRMCIVKLRMWYADIRGHHGKRYNYEPGDWYMGRHNRRNK